MKKRQADKELYCMGIKTKLAKGPNPLSMRKKAFLDSRFKSAPGTIKKDTKRRIRKGKRDRKLSQAKKISSTKMINLE
jgi:hypothetical protein